MQPNLKAGSRVLYRGVEGSILEFIGHDQAMVDLGGDVGVVRVVCSELIAIEDDHHALEKSDLDRIDADVWDAANRRAKVVRDIVATTHGRSAMVEAKASELGLSPRQLWRLVKDYQCHQSVTGMIPKLGGRAVGVRVLDVNVERIIVEKIESYFLVPERPTEKALIERIATTCRDAGLPPPDTKTVKARLNAFLNHEAQKKRLGSKKSRYTYEAMPGHVDVKAPLERVEIDHTPMDVMATSDDPECWYVGRPWLTVAIDVYTRCVLGMYIGFEPPSGLLAALCLTHAVIPKCPASEFGVPLDWPMHGIPKEIYVDNGKEFVSQAFRRGCEEHGITLNLRPIGSPHYGGTIERLIGTMVGQCHLLPGTTKNSVKAKGDYDSEKHAALTLSEVRRWFVEQLLGRYHTHEHRNLRIPPLVAWHQAMERQDDVESA
jgi:transposase InsO family protein